MRTLNDIVAVACLITLTVQDLRTRHISWMPLLLLFASLLCRALLSRSFSLLIHAFTVNIIFLTVQFLLLFVYYSLRHRRPVNLVDTHIGLGDLLFLPVICTAFSPVNFILFYVAALFLSLTGFLLSGFIKRKPEATVPLAGSISICMLVLFGVHFYTGYNLYDDHAAFVLVNL